MKNLIAAICLFCSWNAHSYYAVVKVLEAPLLRAPSEHATVVQTVRKAQRVYLHPSQFLTKEFSMMNGPSDKEHDKEFYKTVDKNGTEAYIKRKYVKVIFKDEREQEKFITLTEVDETDYRLEEPLPRRYPLLDPLSGRGLFAFGVGPGHKTGYPYQTAVEAEQVSTQKGVVFTYQRNVPFDLTNRVFFGGRFQIYADETQFSFIDGQSSKESHGQIGVGPFISYDTWRNKYYRFTMASSITFNYHRSLISRTNADASLTDERAFTGISITPIFSAYLQRREIFPEVDFLLGFDMHLTLPHDLSADVSTSPEFWNNPGKKDEIPVPFGGLYSFFIGIQSHF